MPSSNTSSAEKLSSQGIVKNCTQVPTHSHLRLKCRTTPMKKHEHTNEILLVSIASCNVDNNHFKAIPWAKCWYIVLKVQSIGNNWWRASFIYSLWVLLRWKVFSLYILSLILYNVKAQAMSYAKGYQLVTINQPLDCWHKCVCVCVCVLNRWSTRRDLETSSNSLVLSCISTVYTEPDS